MRKGRDVSVAKDEEGGLGPAVVDGADTRFGAHLDAAWEHLLARRAEALEAVPEFGFGWLLRWDEVVPAWLYPDREGVLGAWQHAVDEFVAARAATQIGMTPRAAAA